MDIVKDAREVDMGMGEFILADCAKEIVQRDTRCEIVYGDLIDSVDFWEDMEKVSSRVPHELDLDGNRPEIFNFLFFEFTKKRCGVDIDSEFVALSNNNHQLKAFPTQGEYYIHSKRFFNSILNTGLMYFVEDKVLPLILLKEFLTEKDSYTARGIYKYISGYFECLEGKAIKLPAPLMYLPILFCVFNFVDSSDDLTDEEEDRQMVLNKRVVEAYSTFNLKELDRLLANTELRNRMTRMFSLLYFDYVNSGLFKSTDLILPDVLEQLVMLLLHPTITDFKALESRRKSDISSYLAVANFLSSRLGVKLDKEAISSFNPTQCSIPIIKILELFKREE